MVERNKPLNTAFVITSMHVGGAETLLYNLIERVDRNRVVPSLICLKELGELGHRVAKTTQTFDNLIKNKFDVRVFSRLAHLYRELEVDAVITVGAGDKMFWGRLAAKWASVPIIASALHSTGWPDDIGLLNRQLTPITDAFIAVGESHREYLRDIEHLPAEKIYVVPNGIDVQRFAPKSKNRNEVRAELGIDPSDPVVGIVAALRPEKDHLLFVRSACEVLKSVPQAKFIILGDGVERPAIEQAIQQSGHSNSFYMLGSRNDTERYLAAFDVFMLTSKNEAKPVSILEALASGVPVVAPDVGSVKESVIDGVTGFLVAGRSPSDYAKPLLRLLNDRELASQLGAQGRDLVCEQSSLESMVHGYEALLWQLNCQNKGLRWPRWIAQRVGQAISIPRATAVRN